MLLDTLKALCALSGPSSYEGPVRTYLQTRAIAAGAETRVDGMGNLICFKAGAKPGGKKLMLTAHMDEVGLMVRRITDDGYLKFACLGEIDRRVLIGKRVAVGKNDLSGVIGLKAIHLTTKEERKSVPKLEELYIDIGAKDREAAEKLTHVGDFVTFSAHTDEFGREMLKAKALDGRIGCGIMIELLEQPLPMDVWFVFTVQQEVGARGAFGAAFSVTPDITLVLDGVAAADIPTTDNHRRACSPGQGPVIPYMDSGAVYDRTLYDLLRTLADEHQIPWQNREYVSGKTDAFGIQRSKAGVRVGAISAAVRYSRTPACVASIPDLEHMKALTSLFISAISEGRIFE